jgi:hypothetical protein
MSLEVFLDQLQDSGNVVVPTANPPAQNEIAACRATLVEMDRLAHLEMPGRPPELDIEAAAWAAGMLYQLCQFLAYREVPAEAIAGAMEQPCPEPSSPAAAYSVDLAFRHLPDLLNLARGLAPGDPLVEGIKDICRKWPLSSVGVSDIGPVSIDAFIGNASLQQLYVDRILERGDTSRADDARVRTAIRSSLGLYETLCPAIAGIIKEGSS